MKIDFAQKLFNLYGEPLEIKDKKSEELVQATLGDICSEALLGVFERDRNEGGKVRYERWQLAEKIIKSSGEVELGSEEIVTIKERVGTAYGPVIVGPTYDLLEGKKDELQTNGEGTAQES